MTIPVEKKDRKHVYNIYSIKVEGKVPPERERDKLRESLTAKGVATAVYYPIPLHLQPVYNRLGWKKGDFPVSEKACEEVLALPVFPELREEEIGFVAQGVIDFLEGKS